MGDRPNAENSVPFNMDLLTLKKRATSHTSSSNAIVIHFWGLLEQTGVWGWGLVQQRKFGLSFMVPYAGILIFHYYWTLQDSKPFSVLLSLPMADRLHDITIRNVK